MDDVGNVYETKNHTERKYGSDGKLLNNNAASLEYDVRGNLIKKTTEDGIWIYTYFSNNLMSGVLRPDGKKITFKYDGLGRRIEKTFEGKTTRFLWDNDTILHEWEDDNKQNKNLITWVFDTDGYTLLSKLTDKENYGINTDYLGGEYDRYCRIKKKIFESRKEEWN